MLETTRVNETIDGEGSEVGKTLGVNLGIQTFPLPSV